MRFYESDRNWLSIEPVWGAYQNATVRVMGQNSWLHVKFEEHLETVEAEMLASGLSDLSSAGAGSFTFESENGWLTLTFVMAKREEFHVSVYLRPGPLYLDEVRLFLNLKQTDLPDLVATVRRDQGLLVQTQVN